VLPTLPPLSSFLGTRYFGLLFFPPRLRNPPKITFLTLFLRKASLCTKNPPSPTLPSPFIPGGFRFANFCISQYSCKSHVVQVVEKIFLVLFFSCPTLFFTGPFLGVLMISIFVFPPPPSQRNVAHDLFLPFFPAPPPPYLVFIPN